MDSHSPDLRLKKATLDILPTKRAIVLTRQHLTMLLCMGWELLSAAATNLYPSQAMSRDYHSVKPTCMNCSGVAQSKLTFG